MDNSEDGKKSSDGSCCGLMDWKKSRMWRIGMFILAALVLAAFCVQAAMVNGRSNIYSNAKSMHFTRNKRALTWTSIFPSRIYTESQAAKMYRTVDGVLDQKAQSAADEHGFQIAAGFGILTNISAYVYISAVLVIAFLSGVDAGWHTKEYSKESHIYFQWFTIATLVVFVSVHLFQTFSVYTHFDWGDAQKLPITYSWESGYSLMWASPVVVLYIVHLNTKHGSWRPIVSAISDDDYGSQTAVMHGPKNKEASVIFAASFFLLTMALLGDIRSTVLESEVQLLVIAAVSVAVVTVLSMRVRAYFDYIQLFMHNKDSQEHSKMISHALALVDVITLAVTLVLVGVTFNVLGYMDAAGVDEFFWAVFAVFGVFLALKVVEFASTLYDMYGRSLKHSSYKMYLDRVFAFQYCATIFLIIVFSFVNATTPPLSENLRKLENSQYASMSAVDLRLNDNCKNAGVQSNSLLKTLLGFQSSKKFKDIYPDLNNPVNFKVWAWTRWWQLEAGSSSTQDATYYLCSVGMEQVFEACRAQYATTPGKALDPTFKTFVNTIDLTTAPA